MTHRLRPFVRSPQNETRGAVFRFLSLASFSMTLADRPGESSPNQTSPLRERRPSRSKLSSSWDSSRPDVIKACGSSS
ncbi:hypothetical protein L596_007711 [Steinernema carpocapsae]|uniref:Uncharacterized protein n=1 Tax=Steinernema carpocapsae TaxID=34508 RepID=A0A4V6A645_STECR|nr:hypothetical protein L596_007711 [Steinernema carpocapsae]